MERLAVYILVPLAFVGAVLALAVGLRKLGRRGRCTALTTAQVIEIIRKAGGRCVSHFLRVRFEAEGVPVEAVEASDCYAPSYFVGMSVDVCYEPANPRNFYVRANSRGEINAWVSIALGAVLLLALVGVALGLIG